MGDENAEKEKLHLRPVKKTTSLLSYFDAAILKLFIAILDFLYIE